jgi:hypothetical protein
MKHLARERRYQGRKPFVHKNLPAAIESVAHQGYA